VATQELNAPLGLKKYSRALARLEGVARENGVAVAVTTGLPPTTDRIAIRPKTTENCGFTLASISAAATRAKSS